MTGQQFPGLATLSSLCTTGDVVRFAGQLSNLTGEGRKTIKQRPERIQEVDKEVERWGGRVLSQHAVLGPYDSLTIVDAPDNAAVVKMSAELGSRGTVEIMTLPAMDVEDFIPLLKT